MRKKTSTEVDGQKHHTHTDMHTMKMQIQMHTCTMYCIALFHDSRTKSKKNKYFELKNSWGAGAPLNSNYLLLLLYCTQTGSNAVNTFNATRGFPLLMGHFRLFDSSSSFELSDLERYRAIKLIAMLFINITVFKDVCKRVSFVG